MIPMNEFLFKAATAGSKSLKLLEESTRYVQPKIGADTFNDKALEAKLENDGRFLVGLGSVLEESEMEKYFGHLETLLEATQDIYKEVNMKPRTCSMAVDTQELTESAIDSIYVKQFTENVNADYSLPLFEGTLLEKYDGEARLLTEASLAAGVTEIDNELFLKYSLFENTLVQNCFSLILPKVLEERTDHFIGQQDQEYFDVFTKNALALKNEITESIINMVSMIAPKMFEESAGIENSGVIKFAGISKALKTTI